MKTPLFLKMPKIYSKNYNPTNFKIRIKKTSHLEGFFLKSIIIISFQAFPAKA